MENSNRVASFVIPGMLTLYLEEMQFILIISFKISQSENKQITSTLASIRYTVRALRKLNSQDNLSEQRKQPKG
ncbi:hypothetical protein QE152_g31273 [Popillia japonica]|uniref:Uncharacterized protein n=1 Tax=Popillia japonica TaxID=7064 RepID=A0AAW1JBL4_POPJA